MSRSIYFWLQAAERQRPNRIAHVIGTERKEYMRPQIKAIGRKAQSPNEAQKRFRQSKRQVESMLRLVMEPSPDLDWSTCHFFFMRDGVSIGLTSEEATSFNSCMDALSPSSERPDRHSRTNVSSLLQQAVVDVRVHHSALPVDQRVSTAITKIEHELTSPPRPFTFCVPVEGIRIGRPVNVGPVRFVKGSTLRPKKSAPVMLGPTHPVYGRVIAYAATREAAAELAYYQVQRALDAVNLYKDRFHPPRQAAAFLPGVRGLTIRTTDYHQEGVTPVRNQWLEGGHRVGAWPIELRAGANLPGFKKLSKLLDVEMPLNAAESRLISAVRWIGRASVDAWNEQAFVGYIIALESLILGAKKDSELTYRLRLRTARIVAASRAKERTVFRALGKLYEIRSAIVHRGTFNVSEEDCARARTYAIATILALLRDRSFIHLASDDAIEEWMECKLLGSERAAERPPHVGAPKPAITSSQSRSVGSFTIHR